MITTILMWTGIGFAHLTIGTSIAKLNLKVWKKSKRSWLSFILFPFNTAFNKVGEGVHSILPPPIEDLLCDDKDIYTKIVAFIWPVKLALNLFPIAIIGAFYTLLLSAKVAGRIVDFVEKPCTMLSDWSAKQWQKKLATAHQLKLSPVDPFLDGYTRDDIETQMEEQRKIVDAATSQAEGAKKEYERLKEIHTTTWSRG